VLVEWEVIVVFTAVCAVRVPGGLGVILRGVQYAEVDVILRTAANIQIGRWLDRCSVSVSDRRLLLAGKQSSKMTRKRLMSGGV
jgi:hypothetical protein